jgi:hypothetical protein
MITYMKGPPPKPAVVKLLAVDIAGMADWTALVGCEAHGGPPRKYRVPLLDRWHDKYAATVERVVAVANSPDWSDSVVLLDATGVGRPIVEQVRNGLPRRPVYGVTFTCGSGVTTGATAWDVRAPKRDLVGAAQLLFQTRRISINPELPLADVLARELVNYTVRITPNTNETFEAGREALNDDLVCGLAMAAWIGERLPRPGGRALPVGVGGQRPQDRRPLGGLKTIGPATRRRR